MSVASGSTVVKLLGDLSSSADKIVGEIKIPRIQEWTTLIQNKADAIVEGENEPGEIPTLMSYVRGTSRKGPRASSVLAEIQRLHVHKGSIKTQRKSRASSTKSPQLRKSNVKVPSMQGVINTPKLKIPMTVVKKTRIISTGNIRSSIVGTPVTSEKKTGRSSKFKRKSSPEISVVEVIKKPKLNEPREKEKSTKGTPRVEKKLIGIEKAKNTSLLPNIKSSVGTKANVSILKEKLEMKQVTASENRKNIMALRQKKLEENKKTRKEKVEKPHQCSKFEKEKQDKLKSGKVEKAVNKLPTTKQNAKKDKEKETPAATKLKELAVKVSDIKKKNQKREENEALNTTYAVGGVNEPSTSSYKGNTVKEVNNKIDSSNLGAKTQTALKKQPIPPADKKAFESYAITPARTSSVSYDISEIRSDSEEEDQETNSKPIPSWATGVRLRNALLQQHHHPIDTDEIFGNLIQPPDLSKMMGVKKKLYNKRTSSAMWNSSFLS